jgi:hypothetical protein
MDIRVQAPEAEQAQLSRSDRELTSKMPGLGKMRTLANELN